MYHKVINMECPEDLICFTEEEWIDFLTEYELDIANEVGTLPTSTSDAEAAINFTWEILRPIFFVKILICKSDFSLISIREFLITARFKIFHSGY